MWMFIACTILLFILFCLLMPKESKEVIGDKSKEFEDARDFLRRGKRIVE